MKSLLEFIRKKIEERKRKKLMKLAYELGYMLSVAPSKNAAFKPEDRAKWAQIETLLNKMGLCLRGDEK